MEWNYLTGVTRLENILRADIFLQNLWIFHYEMDRPAIKLESELSDEVRVARFFFV
jgi:hypothetical protein